MSRKKAEPGVEDPQHNVEDLILRLSKRAQNATIKSILLGAATISGAQGLTACAGETEQQPGDEGYSPGDGKADWAQAQGKRDTSMVAYAQDYFTNRINACPFSRFPCEQIDVYVKVLIKPVADSNLDFKRVGVVYHDPQYGENTATGSFFAMRPDGREEWHVRVSRRSWESNVFTINAWYQDGAGNSYFDDNNGEFYPVEAKAGSIIVHNWQETNIDVGTSGVQGKISLSVLDLDYDKELAMVWTTDGWATANWFGMGDAGETNKWHWVKDYYNGVDNWEMNLDIPGAAERFEYALVYRHGVVNGAKKYEFWENNGGYNFVIVSPPPPVPTTPPTTP